jgi:hypothetical protein
MGQQTTSAFRAGGQGVQAHVGFCFPVPLRPRVNSRTSLNSSSPSTSDMTLSAPALPTTGTAKFMNLRSSDARESGRFESPSGTSTVSCKDGPSANTISMLVPRPLGSLAISASPASPWSFPPGPSRPGPASGPFRIEQPSHRRRAAPWQGRPEGCDRQCPLSAA